MSTRKAPLRHPPGPQLRDARQTMVTAVYVACALVASAQARPHTVQLAQLQLDNPPPLRIDMGPVDQAPIRAADPRAAPRIVPRPRDDAPRLSMPAVNAGPLDPRDPRAQSIQRELQRLLRTAETARPVGSTAASAQAAWQLGLIYLHGTGVRRDPPLAQQWFERAARQGRESWAQAGLAWCYIDGCTGPPDPAAAARAIAQLRQQHPARADFLAWVLASRQTPLQVERPGLTQSPVLQVPNRQLLERSAAAGDMHANIELGMDAVANQRIAQAQEYFRRAGPQSAAATVDMSILQNRAEVMTRSVRPPVSSSAAEALVSARKYHRGEGVPANFTEAIRFYRLAESRGSQEAHRMLELIYSQPSPTGAINPAWMQQLAYVDVATPVPTVGVSGGDHLLLREPTPLYDLLPTFWRQQMTQVGR